jgi:HNH endonuclease/WYL domain
MTGKSTRCKLCKKKIHEGRALADGSLVHILCLDRNEALLRDLEAQIAQAYQRIVSLRDSLKKRAPIATMVLGLFNSNKQRRLLHARVSAQINNEEGRRESLKAAQIDLASRLNAIYDLLLEYPPDWEQRVAEIHERDSVCVQCSSHRRLQVHHKIALGKGGTNRLKNLVLLCRSCHLEAHGTEEFRGRSNRLLVSAMSERINAIQGAIATGKDIEFRYRKPLEKSYTSRRITPSELVQIPHRFGGESTLCVSGWCHLRNATRHFAIKRMRRVRSD